MALSHLPWLETAPADFRERVQAAIAAGDGGALRQLAQRGMTEPQLHQLGRAFAKTRGSGATWRDLTPFRLVLLSNATTDHLANALIATALRYGLNLELFSVSYEEAYTVALGVDARLTAFAPDAVLIAFDYRGVPLRDVLGGAEDEAHTIADATAYLHAMVAGIRAHVGCACIMQTFAVPTRVSFGHADRRIAGTLSRLLAGLNDFVAATADVVIDVAALANAVGTAHWFDDQLFAGRKIPFALAFVPLYADHVARVLGAMRGKSRRVLVLDLDNTLWGGVVGDDGVHGVVVGNGSAQGEAFLDVQRKALALRKRGVLLAVSSKNDEDQARRPFRELPDMLLREDAFASFHANWSDKAANIQAIAEELSLGLDSFVFLDDNPAERALVRAFLPEVAVPELPTDPAGFAEILDVAGYFETVSFSEEDRRRADLYQSRGTITRLAAHDLASYLASLEMQLEISPVGAANRQRVVQLINKSNQFNLTTRRYTDAEVRALEDNQRWLTASLRLRDRLDDHGIISVLLAEHVDDTLQIALWVMSCRVIGRGVERAVLHELVERARARGCHTLVGRYIPTARNVMVAQHYASLGFRLLETAVDGTTTWTLALDKWSAAEAAPIRVMHVP